MEKKYLEDNLSMPLGEWLKYHQENIHFAQKYRGLQMIKNPFDLVVYEELIDEIKPDIIIELGNSEGGFSLWLADRIKNFFGKGKIITVDLEDKGKENIGKFNYNNIIAIVGDCNSDSVIEEIREKISENERVMIIEDSAHTFEHTLKVLENYKNIVTAGSYFIVEDGICDLLELGIKPGPMKVAEDWIIKNANFEIDRSREKYIMTYNPKGYLKRVS
jgi:cephalosporin hydroxylase